MISVLLVYLELQNKLVSRDVLTGLNNKHALNTYVDVLLSRNQNDMISVIMMDMNNFKKINDEHGHLEGDNALVTVSWVLAETAKSLQQPYGLYRYGGDEFIIVSTCCSVKDMEKFKKDTTVLFSEINRQKIHDYELTISVGYAQGVCSTYIDFENLVREADCSMYAEKHSTILTD